MPIQEWRFVESDRCKICGTSSQQVLGFRGGTAHREGLGERCRIVQCRHCKTIYPNPMPFPEGEDVRYSNVDEYFETMMRTNHDERVSLGFDLVHKAESYLGGRGRFLDIGCGRGEIVMAAQEKGWDAVGCDISEQYTKFAREKNKINAINGVVEDLRFSEDTFDFVSMVEVVEHVYDPVATIREVSRILKPGGILYVSTPNEESIYQLFGNFYYNSLGRDWVVNLCPTWNLYHIYGFSPRSIRFLLTENGFDLEETVVYPGTLSVPRRNSLIGKVEGILVDTVEKLANMIGKSPFMFSWARKRNFDAR